MKRLAYITFLALSVALFSTCEKFEVKPLTKVETGTATPQATSLTVNAKIIDLSGEGNTDHGFCYAAHSVPTVDDGKVSKGNPKVGAYTGSIDGLTLATQYYIRAYCQSSDGVVYGKAVAITTLNGQSALTTTAVTSITATTATSGGNITSDGGAAITARGVVWSTSQNPTTTSNQGITSNGTGTGSFTSNLTNLQPGTVYYVRAYATNSIGTVYGNQQNFTTQDGLPILTTTAVTSITATTAISGGNITSDGGFAVTARGVVWSTTQNPTTTSNQGITSNGTGTGSFTSNLTNLQPGTVYYVRAYATNSVGTTYGSQQTFTTLDGVITLTTNAVTSITATTATSGGNITSDGGAAITARGVVWSTSQNPTVETNNGITSNGTGTGSFTSNITNLQHETNYYVRAYATNSYGTQYGNQVSFTTPITVTDADGNVYNTILINGKLWFKENLRTTKYNNGTNIPNVTDNGTWADLSTPAYCWYNNDIANKPTYGALYNWYAVETGNLCPTGWHVPTDAEWYAMENYVDPTINDPNAAGWRGTDGGTKLKATSGWNSGGNGIDSYGFSALPGGYRARSYYFGTFSNAGNYGYWWSSTENDATDAWYRNMGYRHGSVNRSHNDKRYGFSVRCVRD